jgi:hypothetical protein
VAHLQGGQPAAVSYPLGYPTLYGPAFLIPLSEYFGLGTAQSEENLNQVGVLHKEQLSGEWHGQVKHQKHPKGDNSLAADRPGVGRLKGISL